MLPTPKVVRGPIRLHMPRSALRDIISGTPKLDSEPLMMLEGSVRQGVVTQGVLAVLGRDSDEPTRGGPGWGPPL